MPRKPRRNYPNTTHRDESSATRRDEPIATHREELGGTRRDESNATRRDGAPETSSTLLNLPSGLATRYQILKQLPTQGAEADLLLVEPVSGGEQVVIKLYRRGIQPKSEVLAILTANASDHVVRLLDHGQSEGVGYEVLEYCERGSLQDLLAKGSMREAQVRALTEELSAALRELHAQGILHRDLKPGNVLIRSEKPLRLVLTDFGISSVADATLHFTTAHRTVRYAAPEAASGVVSKAGDYWSLGMILAEAFSGQHPFSGLSEAVIQFQLTTQPVPLGNIPEPWLILCRGLLLRDPARRWAGFEIGRWLAGDETLTVPVESAVSETEARRTSHSYQFHGADCWTAQDLATQLARHWDQGVKDLERGLLLPWLRDELRNQELARMFMSLLEDASLTPDERLLRLIVRMAPDQPPVWRGISLLPADLAVLAKRAMQNNASEKGEIQTIYDKAILQVFAEAGQSQYGLIHQGWQEALATYKTAWQKAENAGAPSDLRPDPVILLATLLLLQIPGEFSEQLRSAAQTASTPEAKSTSWFAVLGDATTVPTAVLPLHLALAPVAEERGILEQARQTNTREGYEEYLKRYPQGRFVNEANPLYAVSLEKPVWEKACQTNTMESYEDYLQHYSRGHFVQEARLQLSELLRVALLNSIYNSIFKFL